MSNKVKLYRNPTRDNKKQQVVVPYYQSVGIEPDNFASDNPRMPRDFVRKEVFTPFKPSNSNEVPVTSNSPPFRMIEELGNQMYYPSLDNQVVDDDHLINQTIKKITPSTSVDVEDEKDSSLEEVIMSLEPNEYLLLLQNKPYMSGSLEEVSSEVESMLLGEHKICDGVPLLESDVSVFKKMNLIFGLKIE